MKILRRSLSLLCVLSLLLSLCVCSVSAVTESQVYQDGYLVTPNYNTYSVMSASTLSTSILTDWFNSGPYATDFRLPAGQDSVVVDVISSTGRYARRYVFPQGCNCFVTLNDSLNMYFVWNTDKSDDVLYMYTDYDYDTGTFNVDSYSTIYPDSTTGGRYAKTISYAAGSSLITVGGYVTNGLIVDTAGLGRSLAFPDSGIIEEKKTQGMIATLTQNIKDWFSGLIDSMGNFFDGLADKIKGFFAQLVEDIKGLFVPSDGFFGECLDNFEVWSSEHFGFLFETIEILETTITKFVNFSPSDSSSVTLPAMSFTVHNKKYVLWDSVTFNFNDLLSDISALNTLHTVYFTFVYALFFYFLYKLGEKSYHDIFGGSN